MSGTTAALGTLPAVPSLVTGTVRHARRVPFRHAFGYRVYQWLVDADDLPRPRWPLRAFAGFRAADHLGDPDRGIGDNVRAFCARRGVEVDGRVLMLANARVLGHVFDPLSVFWCLRADGSLAVIVLEVHNTYGERHAYLVDPDELGRSEVEKAFYVSPFFTVDGRYDVQVRLGTDQVSTTFVLRQGDDAVFSATFRGRPRPFSPGRLTRLALTQPLMTQRVSLLIRIHGVRLWLRRLPVVPRRPHDHQEGVS